MHLIDPATLPDLIDSAVDSSLLELELAAAEAQIDQVGGALGEVREYHRGAGRVILLHRRASSVRAVREPGDDADLDPADYRLDADGRALWRLDSGPSPQTVWGSARDPEARVAVFYEAADDLALRQAVALALLRGSLAGVPGVLGLTEGNFTIQFANGATWSSARADVLASIGRPWSFG